MSLRWDEELKKAEKEREREEKAIKSAQKLIEINSRRERRQFTVPPQFRNSDTGHYINTTDDNNTRETEQSLYPHTCEGSRHEIKWATGVIPEMDVEITGDGYCSDDTWNSCYFSFDCSGKCIGGEYDNYEWTTPCDLSDFPDPCGIGGGVCTQYQSCQFDTLSETHPMPRCNWPEHFWGYPECCYDDGQNPPQDYDYSCCYGSNNGYIVTNDNMGDFVPYCPSAGPQSLGSTCGDGSKVLDVFPDYNLPVLPICSNNSYVSEDVWGSPECISGLCMPSFCYCNSGENGQESWSNSFYPPDIDYYTGNF
jgi:hypothetical protein